jgi:hypothetical protein
VAEGGGEEQGTGVRSRTPDVFISYASQDAAVANAVVGTLERSGIKCWIAPRDVPAGAPYADGIIRAINGSKALVLVLSKNAVSSPHVGKEVERASSKRRPIVVFRTDVTPLTPSLEYFLSESQWIESGAGGADAASAKLVEAVQRLIAHPSSVNPDHDADTDIPVGALPASAPANQRWKLPLAAAVAVVAAAFIYFAVGKPWLSRHSRGAVTESAPTLDAVGVAPAKPNGDVSASAPPHSIAVLPFANMSGDPKQDYFSDGLSEELLNSLVAIPALQVAARTSSFTFKGKNEDVADIARKLHVGAVLEASDRALQIDANSSDVKNARGLNYLLLGEFDSARQSCETEKRDWQGRLCMAILYDRLGRHPDAESERAALQAEFGEGTAYQMAEIYAQWGNIPKALDWLDTAYRLPGSGIVTLRVDQLVDPLRKEPRFREIERKLNFPN